MERTACGVIATEDAMVYGSVTHWAFGRKTLGVKSEPISSLTGIEGGKSFKTGES
jgi:curli biogenesis system outer membrane secretion channel CsgG